MEAGAFVARDIKLKGSIFVTTNPRDTPPARAFAGLQQTQAFQPLPQPSGQSPYHLALDSVLPVDTMAGIVRAGHIVLHIVGDTGGVKSPQPQQIVANHMETDLAAAAADAKPAFFYHLGDIVYYYGEASQYYNQFYEPYSAYAAPIIGIPGNHDGDLVPQAQPVVPSLSAYMENFCASSPHLTSEAGDAARLAMTQPNPYFTLETPFATFVGLYTNVPEGGRLDAAQVDWFRGELLSAPADRALIVTMHHPIYSQDKHHGGSSYMEAVLNDAVTATGRLPDIVFAAHVHNYQRYTRRFEGREIPYIVVGSGGYWNLYGVTDDNGNPVTTPAPVTNYPDLTLETAKDDRHGFMRLDITATTLTGRYFTVPRPQESWSAPAEEFDAFVLDLKAHTIATAP